MRRLWSATSDRLPGIEAVGPTEAAALVELIHLLRLTEERAS